MFTFAEQLVEILSNNFHVYNNQRIHLVDYSGLLSLLY